MKYQSKNTVQIYKLLLIGTLLITSLNSRADDLDISAPILALNIESELKALFSTNELNKENILTLVETSVIPNFDLNFFTKSVVKDNIYKMTELEMEKLKFLFGESIKGTTVNLFKNYKMESIIIDRIVYSKSRALAKTKLVIKGASKEDRVIISWRKSDGDLKWLIFDFEIEGVSLLKTKQADIERAFRSYSANEIIERLKSNNVKQ